jgi:hypothetical protein
MVKPNDPTVPVSSMMSTTRLLMTFIPVHE